MTSKKHLEAELKTCKEIEELYYKVNGEKATIEHQYNAMASNYQELKGIILDKKTHELLNLYSMNGKEYLVYAYNYANTDIGKHKLSFQLICLTDKQSLAKAETEISTPKMELVNIDANPTDNGYGTILIGAIEKYACNHGIKRIYGDVHIFTPEGKDILIGFYKKNGYTVYDEESNNPTFEKEIIY